MPRKRVVSRVIKTTNVVAKVYKRDIEELCDVPIAICGTFKSDEEIKKYIDKCILSTGDKCVDIVSKEMSFERVIQSEQNFVLNADERIPVDAEGNELETDEENELEDDENNYVHEGENE